MSPANDNHRRPDMRKSLQRDFARHARKELQHRSFWLWLGVLGMIGWPIAVGSVGGAWLGHHLDQRFNTGIQFTLLLLTIGVATGTYIAWKAIAKNQD